MKRFILTLAAAATIAGCATAPTTYGPASGPAAVGYSEYRIEPGRYRITFRGGPGAPSQQVQDYALLRAAELSLAQGYDWFRVSERFVEGQPDRGPTISLGVGGGSFGGHTAVGVGVSNGFSLGGGPSLSATLEVTMGHGERPRGVDVYDARAVRENLGGRAV